jgi:hypothetical protein
MQARAQNYFGHLSCRDIRAGCLQPSFADPCFTLLCPVGSLLKGDVTFTRKWMSIIMWGVPGRMCSRVELLHILFFTDLDCDGDYTGGYLGDVESVYMLRLEPLLGQAVIHALESW